MGNQTQETNGLNIGDRLRLLIEPRPVSSYRGVDVFRCRSDDCLVTFGNLKFHKGHYVRTPINLNFREKALIWLKIVK